MFKSKVTFSPSTKILGPQKRPNESQNNSKPSKVAKTSNQQGTRFTFDEVKTMIETLLSKQTRASAAVSAGLKKVNYEELTVGPHSVQECKDLLEQLVQSTRRVRTLQEVLTDIRDNLNKRAYTEIIHRASLKGDLPKKPPSAYLLYHQDRYNELRNENNLAVEVSKIVAEEWKTLTDHKRRVYQKKHDELVRKYEKEMSKLGLVDRAAPKRPKSAKTMFIEDSLSDAKQEEWSKESLAAKREELAQYFDNQLTQEEKQRWLQLHKECQEQYLKEREDYVKAHPHLNHTIEKKSRGGPEKPKLPSAPKSALKFFLEKKLPEGLDGQEIDETKKRLKDKFQRLSEKKLLKYIKKAMQDKDRYEKEVEEFKKDNPGREVPKYKANISKEQHKLWARVVENRPSMPAPTAYLHFCGKMLTDMNDNDDEQAPTKRMQAASGSWKESSAREKKAAEKEHLLDVERYIREMEAWLANQTEERRKQVLSEDPKADPAFWKKKLNRIEKARKAEKKKNKAEKCK